MYVVARLFSFKASKINLSGHRGCSYFLFRVQNKGKRVDDKVAGADGQKEDPSSPDTGQQQSDGVACDNGSPAHGAAAALHTNNSSNSYNLVSSLLNLTKSPVSPPLVYLTEQVLVFR